MSFQMMPMTPVVKRLMILTGIIWVVLQVVVGGMFKVNIVQPLALYPFQVIENFYLWQLVTYMFLHAINPFHVLFNMLMLYFFGSELERHWGSKFFTTYYFVTGIGAAILYCIGVAIYSATTSIRTPLIMPVVGASGALCGLLLAYGIIFSERVTYFMGMFPMKAKYFVMVVGGIDFASLLSSGFAGTEAYLAHLGGIAVGYATLKSHAYFKSKQLSGKMKKKNNSLRLVIDNEKTDKDDNPKYWN